MKAPEKTPFSDDATAAAMVRDLEGSIGTLRDMAALMEIAAADTIFKPEGDTERLLRSNSKIRGYRLYILTEYQSLGLDYAVRHLCDLVHALYAEFHDERQDGAA